MKLFVITTPFFFEGESRIIIHLFREGMQRLHLRKPQSDIDRFRLLLDAIRAEYHSRIVLHEHFELTTGYRLAGIHLNSRNNTLPEGFAGSISRSCHSLQEVQDNKQLDYVFLSPIFQSISKEGYGNGFPMETLREAAASGIINEKVIALGGIEEKNIPLIASLHFGGAAILGAFWGKDPSVTNETSIIKRYKQLDIWQ